MIRRYTRAQRHQKNSLAVKTQKYKEMLAAIKAKCDASPSCVADRAKRNARCDASPRCVKRRERRENFCKNFPRRCMERLARRSRAQRNQKNSLAVKTQKYKDMLAAKKAKCDASPGCVARRARRENFCKMFPRRCMQRLARRSRAQRNQKNSLAVKTQKYKAMLAE